MTSEKIRERFLKFFTDRGHKILPSASLLPKNDPSVLFNTAGMQPLVPYLLGQKHPMGKRLVNIQKCVRTGDIDEVGDNRHLTFFEMMGNWSLGDYFKENAIKWSFEFLTSKEEGLGLDPSRMYITVFAGDENSPKDLEALEIWKKYIPEKRIYFLPAKNNWWSVGENGPCGPDSEIFYDLNETSLGDMKHDEFIKADDEGKVIEVWNNVFMEYNKKDGKIIGKLSQKNIDTGMGLERISMVSQNVKTVFDTDLFTPIIDEIKHISNTRQMQDKYNESSARIIVDHIKTAVFMLVDGALPSNVGAGYVLRRILRRAIRHADIIGFIQGAETTYSDLSNIAKIVIDIYAGTPYSLELNSKANFIFKEIEKEEKKFRQTLERGLKEFEKMINKKIFDVNSVQNDGMNLITGQDAFYLFQTYGFPLELTKELADEKDIKYDLSDFDIYMAEHQKLSHTASAGMFKGGLADHNEKTIKLHTAHHLLLAALQAVVDPNIKQRGSNITGERLRMDFLCDHKLTDEEKEKVEDWVNKKIKEGLSIIKKEMQKEEAEKIGAQMEFGTKYPDLVSVYFIEDKKGNIISKEFCGGPHVSNTKELGIFKIMKEESVASGVRRIKAKLF